MNTPFQCSRSSDALNKLNNTTTLSPISFKQEKRVITNLSASRIDELNKRVTEQDIIIASQSKRIDDLEHKLSILIDILERNNNIWFHGDLLGTTGTDK